MIISIRIACHLLYLFVHEPDMQCFHLRFYSHDIEIAQCSPVRELFRIKWSRFLHLRHRRVVGLIFFLSAGFWPRRKAAVSLVLAGDRWAAAKVVPPTYLLYSELNVPLGKCNNWIFIYLFLWQFYSGFNFSLIFQFQRHSFVGLGLSSRLIYCASSIKAQITINVHLLKYRSSVLIDAKFKSLIEVFEVDETGLNFRRTFNSLLPIRCDWDYRGIPPNYADLPPVFISLSLSPCVNT